MMITEAAVSVVTGALVVARAINIPAWQLAGPTPHRARRTRAVGTYAAYLQHLSGGRANLG